MSVLEQSWEIEVFRGKSCFYSRVRECGDPVPLTLGDGESYADALREIGDYFLAEADRARDAAKEVADGR